MMSLDGDQVLGVHWQRIKMKRNWNARGTRHVTPPFKKENPKVTQLLNMKPKIFMICDH